MLRISFPFRYFFNNKISITIRIKIKMILPLGGLTNIIISVYVNILHPKFNLVKLILFIKLVILEMVLKYTRKIRRLLQRKR